MLIFKYNVENSEFVYYSDGTPKNVGPVDNDSLVKYIKGNDLNLLLLLGPPHKTAEVQKDLESSTFDRIVPSYMGRPTRILKRFDIICIENSAPATPQAAAPTQPVQGTQEQQYVSQILDHIDRSYTLLKQEIATVKAQPSPTTHQPANNSKINEIATNVENIEKQQKYFFGELLDSAQRSGGDNGMVVALKNELSEYKEDFYRKSMQRYGVDAMMNILKHLYQERYELLKAQQDTDRIDQHIKVCTSEAKRLNIRLRISAEGDMFDGNSMVYYDDTVPAPSPDKRGQVACSITPAFYWTLPRVNAPNSDDLLLQEEVVALYE